jgi:hypothetical protein
MLMLARSNLRIVRRPVCVPCEGGIVETGLVGEDGIDLRGL